MSRRQLEMRPSVRLSRQDVSQRPFDAIHLLANHSDRLLMAGDTAPVEWLRPRDGSCRSGPRSS